MSKATGIFKLGNNTPYDLESRLIPRKPTENIKLSTYIHI